MHNTVFIISANYTLFKHWPANADKNIYPSIVVNQTQQQQIVEVYKFCHSNLIPSISISVEVDSLPNEAFIENIVSFLFIPYYCTISNNRVINLIGTNVTLLQETKNNILEAACKQDIKNLIINCPVPYKHSATPDQANNTDYLFTETETLLKHYQSEDFFESTYNGSLFLYDEQVNLDTFNTSISEVEKKIRNKNPLLYDTKAALQNRVLENEALSKKIFAAEAELKNYQSHLEILRSSHQAKELQDYYDKEYEVLPLWYKRVGHLIKVITGKRSFRSLFNNKIKKSTD